jgi:hypothetical protein
MGTVVFTTLLGRLLRGYWDSVCFGLFSRPLLGPASTDELLRQHTATVKRTRMTSKHENVAFEDFETISKLFIVKQGAQYQDAYAVLRSSETHDGMFVVTNTTTPSLLRRTLHARSSPMRVQNTRSCYLQEAPEGQGTTCVAYTPKCFCCHRAVQLQGQHSWVSPRQNFYRTLLSHKFKHINNRSF